MLKHLVHDRPHAICGGSRTQIEHAQPDGRMSCAVNELIFDARPGCTCGRKLQQWEPLLVELTVVGCNQIEALFIPLCKILRDSSKRCFCYALLDLR